MWAPLLEDKIGLCEILPHGPTFRISPGKVAMRLYAAILVPPPEVKGGSYKHFENFFEDREVVDNIHSSEYSDRP